MPEFESRNPEHPKTIVRLGEGETVALCRCFASKTFPLCDGSHQQHPGRGPAVVMAPGVVEAKKPPAPPA